MRSPLPLLSGLSLLLLTLLTLLTAPAPTTASVIGIDFGAEWFKVSLVKGGVPLEIVLNAETKRKTPAVVLVREGDRRYGADAVALSTRFPQDTYPSLKNLLGKLYEDPVVAEYRQTFTNTMIRDPERGTVAFRHNETTTYSVEELVAMQLAFARKQAEASGGEFVAGAVITVPPYWGQFERAALLEAAKLAELRVFALINDETAVAVNYASARNFPEPQYHIFYDMGAGSTVAALVRFNTTSGKKTGGVTEIDVLAVGYDPSLGGHSLDVKLQRYLASEAVAKLGDKLKGDLYKDSRAMARLLKEATRVKQILSANTETTSSIEGLIEDLDFRTKITRAKLEELCKDEYARVSGPVESVLKQADITIDKINSLVLVGGGVRVPFVQAALTGLVGEAKIAKNINGDEAAVMGAGFRAATISPQFRVRDIRIKDINLLPAEIAYETEPKEGSTPRTIRTTIFSDKTLLGAKKLMNFKRKTDFEFELTYKLDGQPIILTSKIAGLAEAIESRKNRTVEEPKVKALLELSESGIITVTEATAQFSVEEAAAGKDAPSIKDTVLNFFKGKKGDDKSDETESQNVSEEVNAELPKLNATTNATAPKVLTETAKLNLTISWATVKPISEEALAVSRAKLAHLEKADSHRLAREEARNTLESFYYSAKQLLFEDDIEHTSTEDERNIFTKAFDEISDWLYDAADSAPIDELKAKLKSLKDVHSPLVFKHKEHRTRDKAVEALKSGLGTAKSLLVGFQNATLGSADDTEPRYTKLELSAFEDLVTGMEDWLTKKLEEQAKLKPYETPVLVVKELKKRAKAVEAEAQKLLLKPIKRKTKSQSSKTTSTSTSTATATSTNTTTSTTTTSTKATIPAETVTETETASQSTPTASSDKTDPETPAPEAKHDEL
ncbi:Hsp70 protein-domain-containing protein [Fimicolochytrium jonesii]|uniref:Hsp70 protein-domain-containing protein n=1 Tax=Fimicolochytrium jonesii TaxID=1396493 RepID=UPI0022FF1B4C|nr:Hsp70 protein-domain-containing protein [Fimicolochytrium jonesii]KAI8816337.1 Hsp70 protein-domain-containing protein [Fimicolochytrium jonesii]